MYNENELGFAMLGGGVIGAILGAIGIIVLVWYVFQIIAGWKIFTKAGEKGWKSIVPLYNIYTQYKLTWKTSMFWIMLALAAASGICSSFESTVTAIVSGLASIATVAVNVIGNHKLSKSFGHGVGFTLGLIFLYPIFSLILAFGGSEYIGNTCEMQA